MTQPSTPARPTDRGVRLAYGIHRSASMLESHVSKFARQHDLEAAHLSILHVLGLRGEMRMTDLADRVIVGAPTMTRRAKQLEARGLVTRARSERSQREVLINLTASGQQLFEQSFAHLTDRHGKYFDDRLSLAEQRHLERLLDKL